MLPARGTEAARLSAIQLRENGRGANDGSRTLGYYDAPSLAPRVHDFETWLNYKEIIGLNVASLAPITNYNRKDRAMGFTGPGIANDWVEIEGPLNDIWPPESHRRLFGALPLAEFKPKEHPETHPPLRPPLKQEIIGARNRVDKVNGIWTVQSTEPLVDARRLLASFLPRAFRHPVEPEVLDAYVAQAGERLKAGDCFELAMRYVFRAALCSTDFLYHVEPAGKLDEYALANRLSYFFWNSAPDEALMQLAAAGKLHEPENLRAQTERLLKDAKAQRFVEDFTGQWLRLRELTKNDPDKKLYPEFSPYLQDCLRNETIAYFRALVDKDLDAGHLVRSEFGMLNEKLGQFYGIPDIKGSAIREVALPPGCPRGPFLTQGAILKVTANGTTTSPVVRGAFVMARLLGQPPEPPPPNTPAVEPDVRGAKTIREQLDKHRNNATCAACHARIDPPGLRAGILRRHRRPARTLPRDRRGYRHRLRAAPRQHRSRDPHQVQARAAGRRLGQHGRRPQIHRHHGLPGAAGLGEIAPPAQPRAAIRDLRHRPRDFVRRSPGHRGDRRERGEERRRDSHAAARAGGERVVSATISQSRDDSATLP